MPDIVTIDPRMLKDEEPEKVVCTALAALTYAAESYAAGQHNPFSATYAQLAVDFVMNNLLDVVKESLTPRGKLKALIHEFTDKNAQVALANAACMAGYVYSNTPEGLASKLGRALSAYCDTCEGLLMGILLPYVLEYHAVKNSTDMEKLLLPMAGLDLYCSTPGYQRSATAIGKIRQLQNELYSMTSGQLPRTLEDTRLSKDKLPEIAAKAMEDKDVNGCLTILEHAYTGRPVTA
jgi:alcohol dehydrogenase class IV